MVTQKQSQHFLNDPVMSELSIFSRRKFPCRLQTEALSPWCPSAGCHLALPVCCPSKQWCHRGHSGCLGLPTKWGSWPGSRYEAFPVPTAVPSSKGEPTVWQAGSSGSVSAFSPSLTHSRFPKLRALFLVSWVMREWRPENGKLLSEGTWFLLELCSVWVLEKY